MTRSKMWLGVFIVLLIASVPVICPGAPAKDEVLRIVAAQEPLNIDLSQFSSGNDRIVMENITDFLLHKDTNGKIIPALATWKVSEDGKKYDFTLRKGVKFHSGDSFTAKDVLFSYERAMKLAPGVKANMTDVEKIEMVDDYRVTVRFKVPYVLFILNQAHCPVVSKSYYDRVGEDSFVRHPVGTGAYKFVGYRPGEYLDLERFEDYWDKKPPVKKVRFTFVSEDSTRLAKLKAGEADFIQGVSYPDVRELEKSRDFKVVKLETVHPTRSVMFGTNNPRVPWYDKRVRLAMALAIDCDTIIKEVLFGIAIRLAGLAPYELGYDPQLKPYPYDPKKAKALLAEAGYPNGFALNFYWQSGGRSPMTKEIVEAIASYWQAVGIRAKLIGEDTAASLARRNNALKPDAEYVAFYTAGPAGGIDPSQPLRGYFSGQGSRPVFTTPEITKTITEATQTFNDKKRGELIKKAVKMIHDEVGIISVHNSIAVYGMKKNVDFTPSKRVNFDFMLVRNMAVK
jgi:peptide/nickel transport system substrate-binding protein